MNQQLPILFQIVFGGIFALTLLAGIYLYRNDQRIFGTHPDHASETEAGRSYNRTQVWAIWVHLLFVTALFALILR